MGKKQAYIPPLIGWLYDLVLWTFSVLIDLFFREVHPRGSWKIPRRGPIIIVAAPHANQVREFHTVPAVPTLTRPSPVVRRFPRPDARHSQRSAPSDLMAHRGKVLPAQVYRATRQGYWDIACRARYG